MIELLDKNNKLLEHKNSLCITYPRTVDIIFGHYPYPDHIHNFLVEIKNNLSEKMTNYTNVKGGMTEWTHFLNNPLFNDFINFLINKHQSSKSEMFEHFYEKFVITEAWGNEIKKGDRLNFHRHLHYHGILYLTEGCDLILPDLNLKIKPKPGEYYVFPPEIYHGFDKSIEEDNRYSLVFNINVNDNLFKYLKKKNKI
jgi:hypothetical protein